jgi:uncharacterized membrane protein YphA (DoxX/SURF4 family)
MTVKMEFGKKILVSPWPYCLVRFGLAAIFVWAGLIKLADPESFAKIISAYELVPESWLVPVAIGLPALEVLAGLGLIFDVRGSLVVIFGLLVMFVFVLPCIGGAGWVGFDFRRSRQPSRHLWPFGHVRVCAVVRHSQGSGH